MIGKGNIFVVILSVAKNPKNQSKVFGYFAYAQYDNEKIKRNGLPRFCFVKSRNDNERGKAINFNTKEHKC